MGAMERRKGARAEVEVARILTDAGFKARRDGRIMGDILHSLPGLHLEVKRQERVQIMEWLKQATVEADERGCAPVVVWRRSNMDWQANLPLATLLDLAKAAK